MGARTARRRHPPSSHLRPPPHVRDLGDRQRVNALELAKVMGTSTAQLEDTYWRWLTSTADRVRAILEAADVKEATG